MSTTIDTVFFEDDYWINDRVELLKLVWVDYWLTVVKSMRDAYDTALDDDWFYLLLRDSGLFTIFQTFPSDNIDIIKAFISYDNNPSFNNFSKIIDFLFPNGAIVTILTQEVIIDINALEYKQFLAVKNTVAGIDGTLTVKNTSANINSTLNVLFPLEFILAEQSFYILRHFIPVGTKLTVNLVTDDLTITGNDGTNDLVVQGFDGTNNINLIGKVF